MIAVATLQGPLSQEAHVSSEAEEVARPIWRLLNVGWEMGLSTSMTESETCLWLSALAQRFQTLAKTWRDECAHLSSIREMVLHPAYQQIVGMGRNALPFIVAELERRPDHWFWALRAITGEDPVPPEHRGEITEMVRDWLEWAQNRGIQW